jgi:hypothetical protein
MLLFCFILIDLGQLKSNYNLQSCKKPTKNGRSKSLEIHPKRTFFRFNLLKNEVFSQPDVSRIPAIGDFCCYFSNISPNFFPAQNFNKPLNHPLLVGAFSGIC